MSCIVIIGWDGLEYLDKLICGLDSEFGHGSGCGIGSFGIPGVSDRFKDCGDAGIPAEGGTEGRDASIPAEGGREGSVSDRFGDVGILAEGGTKGRDAGIPIEGGTKSNLTFQKFSSPKFSP